MSYDPISPTTKGILRKLGGDKISGKKYTYDGKSEELEKFPDISEQYTYAKIAKDAPSLHTLKKIGGTFANGSQIEASAEELTIETAIDGDAEVAYMTYMGSTVPFLVYSMGNLFVYSMAGFGYCSKVEFAETIVPIDPKYLPGVTIDLDEYGIDIATLVMSGGGTVDVEGTEEMWKKICENAQGNIKCSVQFDGATFCLTPSVLAIKEGEVTVLGMTLVASYGATAMVSANIILRTSTSIQSPNGRKTHVHSTVTQTPIPS